jgi:Tol biopolymer transport system component
MTDRLLRCVSLMAGLAAIVWLDPVALPGAGALPDSPGATVRVSVKSGGAQADAQAPAGAGQPAVSDNGAAVAFVSDATNLVSDDRNGVSDVFVRQNDKISRVSLGPNFAEADGPSSSPSLSADGRFVAFTSEADNLVPGDTNTVADVFVYDRQQSTARKRTAPAGPRRSTTVAPSWPSRRRRRTSSRATPTTPPTSSSGPPAPARRRCS